MMNSSTMQSTKTTTPAAAVANNGLMKRIAGYEHLVAGISGGVTSTLILHPLDLLKVRFAVPDTGRVPPANNNNNNNTSNGTRPPPVQRPQYTGISNATSVIWKTEGIKGFYKGVTPNLFGAGTAWGLYFFFYNITKGRQQKDTPTGSIGPGKHMLAAAEAGVYTQILTNPLWVVKTRLCLQYESPTANPNSKFHYTGMVDAFLKTYKHEGIRGLYKGMVPGLFGVSHGALQFMAYEELKVAYNEHLNRPTNARLTTSEYLAFAALSKLFAAVTTYPYQVLRARMQDQHAQYDTLRDCIRFTWRVHGAKGFYRGLLPSLMRVVPATATTFLVYENLMYFMLGDEYAPHVKTVATKKEPDDKPDSSGAGEK